MECPKCLTPRKSASIKICMKCRYNFDTGETVLPKASTTLKTKNRLRTDRVIIEDIHMSFSSMVMFMVKWAIASVPAIIILIFIGTIIFAMFGMSLSIFN